MFRISNVSKIIPKVRVLKTFTIPVRRASLMKPDRGAFSTPPSLKEIEELKLVPEDYKIIYVFNGMTLLNIGHAFVLFSSLVLPIYIYLSTRKPTSNDVDTSDLNSTDVNLSDVDLSNADSSNIDSSTVDLSNVDSSNVDSSDVGNSVNYINAPSYHYSGLALGYFICHALLYGVLRRTVRVMYIKGDQLKSVFYGFLGPYSKIIIDHKVHQCGLPKYNWDFFHYINDKRVFLFSECFTDFKYYLKVVRNN